MSGARCLLLALSISALNLPSVARGQEARRQVTVADVISMTRLGDPRNEPVKFSPDGQAFVIVFRKGSLQQNTNDYSLLLWRTSQVFNGAKPEVLLALSSSSNRPAIRNIHWQPDNKTIIFLGERLGELQQIYSLNISTHVLNRLSSSQTNIVSYTMSSDGERILYASEPNETSVFNEKARREGMVVSTEQIGDIVTSHKNVAEAVFNGDVQFYLQVAGKSPQKLQGTPRSSVKFDPPQMSPDGKYAVILGIVNSIPASWKDYMDPSLQWWTQHKRTPLPTGQRVFLLQTVLLDTQTGECRPLLNSPTSTSSHSEVGWSPDSQSVVITNTYLPLTGIDANERDIRLRTRFAAIEFKISDHQIAKISNENVNTPTWVTSSRVTFRTNRESAISRISFARVGGNWVRVKEDSATRNGPEVVEEEDLNQPPRIIAIDPRTRQRPVLLDLNPTFADLRFGHEEPIAWKGSDGHDVKGGLYYPVGYERGRRYPLVIQTHAFVPDKFWIDGPFSTAFAAQPLAGHGIMVLQMDEDYSDSDSPKEVDREMASLEGAIDYLDRQGLIDLARVGVIGFSRTCLHVKFALTHSDRQFAAASVSDGVDNGYFQYVLAAPVTSIELAFDLAFEGSNGGLPFGEGLKSWMKRAPGFNADKVRTPLLIFAPNPRSALFQWEWYAALKRLDKAVEMIVMEDGEHVLQRPSERNVSLQSNVDWFRFWLKGEEDPDPAKKEQYARWRELRKLQPGNSKQTARKATQP